PVSRPVSRPGSGTGCEVRCRDFCPRETETSRPSASRLLGHGCESAGAGMGRDHGTALRLLLAATLGQDQQAVLPVSAVAQVLVRATSRTGGSRNAWLPWLLPWCDAQFDAHENCLRGDPPTSW